MDSKKRDLYISLCFGGGDPDLAYLHNHSHSIEDYEKALATKEYKDFALEVQERFFENCDLRLLGNLFRAECALQEIGPSHKNYPAILRNYKELLSISSPIIERLSKVKIESNVFEGLELVIKGVGKEVGKGSEET